MVTTTSRSIAPLRCAAVAALLSGCSGCGHTIPPTLDATVDSGGGDDAVAIDGPASDVPTDATSDAAWTVLPGLPSASDCVIEIAADPASAVDPLRWIGCADGTPGCRELVVPPGTSGVGAGGSETSTGATIVWLGEGRDGGRTRLRFTPVDGAAFAVLEIPHAGAGGTCALSDKLVSLDGAAFSFVYSLSATSVQLVYFAGPLNDDPAWRIVAAQATIASVWALAGVSARSLITGGGGQIHRSDPSTTQFTTIADSTTASGGVLCCANAWHGYALFDTDGTPNTSFVAAPGTAPVAVLVHSSSNYSPMLADRNNLYWFDVDANDAGAGQLAVWTSPFASTPSALAVRRMGGSGIALPPATWSPGGGRVAFELTYGGPVYRIINTDGTYWDVHRPVRWTTWQLAYLSAAEIAFEVGSPSGSSIIRFDLAALGAPTAAIP